ncbi:hypothetical protein [Streptomyces spiramenti]|uniref:Uncharacterized protein n=1 Tax=Streptomyces spiramenti TaxID=2720606 RepID=A0ABX1ATA9_9ACTN|nr:hypothetical protein [Streptomyces spiramenti]NJP68295.1 hypothetical protein [Streptomyces spiramenti]
MHQVPRTTSGHSPSRRLGRDQPSTAHRPPRPLLAVRVRGRPAVRVTGGGVIGWVNQIEPEKPVY